MGGKGAAVLAQQLVNGLMLGSAYALIGIAFALILGILDMLNVAIGEVFMLGAFLALAAIRFGLPWPVAVLTAMVGGAAVNLIIERLAFRPLRNAPPITPLLSTIAFSLVLQNVATNIWTSEQTQFPVDTGKLSFDLGPVRLTSTHLLIFGTALVVMVVLDFIIHRTKIGRGMRAVAESPEAAGILGVEPGRIITATFSLAGAIAGVAGVLLGLAFSFVSPMMGVQTGLKGLAAMVVGGLGNVRGAIVGGLVLGVTEVLSVAYLRSEYRDMVVYGLLFVVLVIRPQGLLGSVIPGRGRV